MTDVPSFVVLAAGTNIAVASTVNRLSQIVEFLRSNTDHRATQIRIQLKNEIRRTQGWLRRTGNIENLRLSRESEADLKDNLEELHYWTDQTVQRLRKYGLEVTSDSRNVHGVEKKLRIFGGYIDLQNLTETVRSLNDGLESIAPPPPSYWPALQMPSDIPSVSTIPSESGISQRVASNSQEGVSSTEVMASNQTSNQTSQETGPIFERLYIQCLEVFSAVIYRLPSDSPDFDYVLRRFRLWGVNLFEGSIGLDRMMVNLSRMSIELRTFLLGTLGDIILTLGSLVRYVIIQGHRDMEVEHAKLMGLFTDEELAGATFENSPYLDPLEEDAVEPEFAVPMDKCKTQLEGLVECLFEVLPTVRRFRQVYFIEMERQSKDAVKPAEETSVIHSSAGKIKDASSMNREDESLDVFSLDLQLAMAIQKSLDEEAGKIGESKHADEITRWKEEISKLQDLKGLMSTWSNQTLSSEQEELRQEVYQNYGKVACSFASVPNIHTDISSKTVEKSLRKSIMVPDGSGQDLKILSGTKSPKDALWDFSAANAKSEKLVLRLKPIGEQNMLQTDTA